MEWIISDTHFGHANIIKYCNRPFSSAQEMDETIIKNWNARIAVHDKVYHLGDFTLQKSANEYLDQLNGKILFIPGSHDYWLKKVDREKYHEKLEILPLYKSINVYGKKVILCHYPMASWEASYHGSLHFHGHSHGNSETVPHRFDVGVDVIGYSPVALIELVQKCSFPEK